MFSLLSDHGNWTEVEEKLTKLPNFCGPVIAPVEPSSPMEYFRSIVDDELLEKIVYESNLYAVQQDSNKPLCLSKDELEQFLGINFLMSIVKMPRTRSYWEARLRYDKVADVMPCRRYEEIKRNIHLNDNEARPADCADKLYKVRRLVSKLQEKFSSLAPSEHLSIDEQIIPFKGKSGLKQYNPKKAQKMGL